MKLIDKVNHFDYIYFVFVNKFWYDKNTQENTGDFMRLLQNKGLKYFTLTLIGTLIMLPVWLHRRVGHLDFEQILFLIKSDGQGTTIDWPMIGSFLLFFIPVWVVVIILVYYTEKRKMNISLSNKKLRWPIVLVVLVTLIVYDQQFEVSSFFIKGFKAGDLYERYYVKPDSVEITFPNKKRNLIYIVLESMENNYSQVILKDESEVDLIPHIKHLARKYDSFSNTNTLGGPQEIKGASWTAASLVAQTSGIPIRVSMMDKGFGEEVGFLPGLMTLGDILKDAGYRNYFMAGSDANFGGRETYFKSHGDYEIRDIKYYKEIGMLEEDYSVFWGYEDAKLFEFAKHELLEISKNDEPFNYTMLTVDTHFTDGYTDLSCNFYYEEEYANAISCSDRKVYDFINWIEQQDFYENTTIILMGDHQTMNHEFASQMVDTETRTMVNVFINAKFNDYNSDRLVNRNFSALDAFPTTLTSLGVDIEGDRLGLGVNLMSDKETLMELLRKEGLDEEISKHSVYYNTNFLLESLAD